MPSQDVKPSHFLKCLQVAQKIEQKVVHNNWSIETILPSTRAAPIHPEAPHLSPRRNHAKPAPQTGSNP